MKLLIDGYNLLHLSTISSPGSTGAGWAGWRNALLDFLVEALDPALLAQTTIVFDAADAPKHLPSRYEVGGMKVLFAKKYQTADEQIAAIISRHTSPKKLTVVSSDHAVQRSARRRKAMAIDSEVWLARLARRRNHPETTPSPSAKPKGPLAEAEIDHWLEAFALEIGDDLLDDWQPKSQAANSVGGQASHSNLPEPTDADSDASIDAEIQAFAEAAFLNLEFDEIDPTAEESPYGMPPTKEPHQGGHASLSDKSGRETRRVGENDFTSPFTAEVWEDLARIFAEESGE